MQKQNGNYDQALKTFKLSVKELAEKNNSWVLKNPKEWLNPQSGLSKIKMTIPTHWYLPLTVNSYDAEFPHDFKDNKLIFSSLKADSLNQQEEVYSKSIEIKSIFQER